MSDIFKIYMVDENRLSKPSDIAGLSDTEKYNKLVKDVENFGSLFQEIKMSNQSFNKGLKMIDEEIGNTGFLTTFAYNNSPHNILGNNGECPAFGYFSPEQTEDLNLVLSEIQDYEIEDFKKKDPDAYLIFSNFKSAAAEAFSRKNALAILHQ